MKFCKNCVFIRVVRGVDQYSEAKCAHPSAIERIDLVSGGTFYKLASIMRHPFNPDCGSEGKLFKSINEN